MPRPDLLSWHDPWVAAPFWLIATLAFYWAGRRLYRFHAAWWSSPLVVTPGLLILLSVVLHSGYHDYLSGTHWLMMMFGPVTVAFALPIYEQRVIILRHWPLLVVGVLVGSSLAMLSAWELATLFGFDGALRLSLLPRSVSAPFAVVVSAGEAILKWLPLRSNLARGALLGMSAHGAGVAAAHRVGREEGSIAGLVMILAGLFNVLAAPFLAYCLR